MRMTDYFSIKNTKLKKKWRVQIPHHTYSKKQNESV